ncbi:SRPBCC family protein [Ornithinimicrobium pratense]|uniref:SRPBCC family protein n=1 Tax=Ornithinimicrobium pratense TaxID=2593973 RepID=A0A5J6V5X3_9MICO|nr:SRPBCC family protein [Ornithinimicrobium pratense]QFG68423.1 SRPBCC family protein [Ornithinimicrobium pratense]
MKIRNTHRRHLTATADEVDTLLGGLGSDTDALWPRHLWFPMRLDRPVAAGAKGGHGPVRYQCTARARGCVFFEFVSILGSSRWHGEHRFVVRPRSYGSVLVHELELEVPLWQYVQWVLVVGPLHDAVLEDLLDRAEGVATARWSLWVRLLRRALPAVRAERRVNP